MSRIVLNEDILAIVLHGQTLMHPDGTIETRRFVGDGPSSGHGLEGMAMREMIAIKTELDAGPHNRKERRAAAAKERSRRPKKKARY